MSFLVALALALGLGVVAPIAAHLLRRGRAEEQEFPAAALVPVAYRSAKKRSRLEDRWLLLVRALLILVLSIVGAVPFVRCSRLALDRDAGASVALAIVLDDSLSMRTRQGDRTRWERALKGARDLLESTREGDAVGIVLAGKPARMALSATTDLGVVRDTLDKLTPQDRGTDLDSAVRLAESALKSLPHVDKRVAVLSDFATDIDRLAGHEFWAPLSDLRKPSSNCGLVRARLEGRRVLVDVACNNGNAARNRKLRLTRAKGLTPNPTGDELASVALKAQGGSQQLQLKVPEGVNEIDAFLTGGDALEQDDYAPVAEAESAMLIGIVADPTTAAAPGGSATVVEQALGALNATRSLGNAAGGEVRPLPLVPEDAKELSAYAALIIDDPPGLTPEARNALSSWLEGGGFAAAFLGPGAESAQLGSSFEPFAHGALTWETTAASGIADGSSFLGDAGNSLKDLAPKGRLRLTGAQSEGAEVVLRWSDQVPWMLKRHVGRGQVWTFGLPVSVEQSDLSVRPGFLALLERFVHDAAQTNGQRVTQAGDIWKLDQGIQLIEGPTGKLETGSGPGQSALSASAAGSAPGGDTSVGPAIVGRYRVVHEGGDSHQRIVTIDESEVLTQPKTVRSAKAAQTAQSATPNVEVSREFALLLLVLVICELLLRLVARLRLQNQSPA